MFAYRSVIRCVLNILLSNKTFNKHLLQLSGKNASSTHEQEHAYFTPQPMEANSIAIIKMGRPTTKGKTVDKVLSTTVLILWCTE